MKNKLKYGLISASIILAIVTSSCSNKQADKTGDNEELQQIETVVEASAKMPDSDLDPEKSSLPTPEKTEEFQTQASEKEDLPTENDTEVPYIYDESMLSDPPEGEISLFDAQTALNKHLRETQDASYFNKDGLAYVYNGIVDYDNCEHYSISLSIKNADGYHPLENYIVSGKGSIYVAREEAGNTSYELVFANEPAWWGEYDLDNEYTVGISNYNLTSFHFSLSKDGEFLYSGLAGVYPDDLWKAQVGDLEFSLGSDSNTLILRRYYSDDVGSMTKIVDEIENLGIELGTYIRNMD